jgi:tetratricopeptide (TPR) repeat protein
MNALTGAVDLGDEFLNQVFARALQRTREQRLIEADHLMDVLRAAGISHPAVLYESASLLVSLGRPQAHAELCELDTAARETGIPFLRAMSAELRGAHLELLGSLRESVAATLSALEIAEAHQLHDLAVRLTVTCTSRMAMACDSRAETVLSNGILRAERLGNRLLLCDAYCTAARMAGFNNDWIAALRHQVAAAAIARTMPEAARSLAYGCLSLVQTELGQLNEAAESASIAFRAARISGAQPQQGLAAGQAMLAYVANRRVRDAVNLYGALQLLTGDTSVAMQVARDVYCRARLLYATGRFDESLEAIDAMLGAASQHPRLLNRCRGARIQALMKGRRFDELEAFCKSLLDAPQAERDARLNTFIDRALAFRDYLAFGRQAEPLERLHRLIRSLAASEAHAMVSLDAAWLHLERGEPKQAESLVSSLQGWLEQSQPGMLVAGRLRHAIGDRAGALEIHQACVQRYPESMTEFQQELLRTYERSSQAGREEPIPMLEEPISLHWTVAPAVLAGLPAELGGGAPKS